MPRAAQSGEINGDAFDRFTFVHAGAGAAARLAGVPPWAAAVAAVLWEIFEDPLKDALPALFPHASADSKENAIWDVAAFMGGYMAAGAIKR